MTLIRDDEVQAGIVSYLKASVTVTAQLPAGALEIREESWQGRDFTYPNVRVRMISNTPMSDSDGCPQNIMLGVQGFSESDSSQEADRITGIIGNVLHGKSFVASNGVRFHLFVTNLIPAVRSDERTWRSEVLVRGRVS